MLHLLLQQGDTSIDRLAALVGASPASVRRDLVQRRHGGAELAGEIKFGPFRFDSAFSLREQRFPEEKRHIAAAAAALVEEGDVLAIGPGTTTTLLGRNLRHREHLQIVTSTLNIGIEPSACPNLEVTLTGGTSRWSGRFSLVGPTAFHSLQRMHFDRVCLSGTAVDAAGGLSVIESDEALMLGEMVRRGRQLIVLADSSKLGIAGPHTVCGTRDMHTLITCNDADPPQIEAFRQHGVITTLT